MPSTSQLLLAGLGAAAATAALVYILITPRKVVSKPAQAALEESTVAEETSAEAKPEPEVAKTLVVEVLGEITNQMSQILVRLAQIEQEVRQQMAGKVTEEQMQQYLMNHFMEGMAAVEKQVYAKHGVTEEQMQYAATYWKDDAEVKKASENFMRLFKVLTGQSVGDVEVPEHLTMDKTLDVIQETMEGMTKLMEKLFADLAARGLKQQTPEFDTALQQEYSKGVDVVRTEVQKKFEVAPEELQAAVYKYKDLPNFNLRMAEMDRAQKEAFARLGVMPAAR